ncbi:hypothetical protein Tcan_06746 [Toxocara canis]|uniref:CSN8/PSMD8/EIF3K domain-containing protein n=2 Tax=Toxocara canis TaxID=6265 RepID=A0A0B2UV82_TOXCA|nr:hypothetical protein Tcan_06746 [Toxocara canis]VDM36604.1 unnamed protein product [Toxocara canis]
MSEVPDIVQSNAERMTHNTDQTTALGADSPAVVPAREDNLMMDAEDSLPAIHLQTGSADGAGEVPATTPSPSHMDTNDEVPFGMQIAILEQRELQMDGNEITAEFYSQMLACYLIQQDWTKALLCRMRAASFDDSQLRAIIAVSQHLENGETGPALRLIKSTNFTGLVKTLMDEVQSRVCVSTIRQIEMCYMVIECSRLAQMLDATSETELQQILALCGWVVGEGGFVRPEMTPQLQTLISEKEMSPYGPLPNTAIHQRTTCPFLERNPNEDLLRLARIASFMEAAI